MAGYVELAKIKKKEKEHEAADTQMGAIESVQRSMRRGYKRAYPAGILRVIFGDNRLNRTIHWALGNSHRYHVRISEDWSR